MERGDGPTGGNAGSSSNFEWIMQFRRWLRAYADWARMDLLGDIASTLMVYRGGFDLEASELYEGLYGLFACVLFPAQFYHILVGCLVMTLFKCGGLGDA